MERNERERNERETTRPPRARPGAALHVSTPAALALLATLSSGLAAQGVAELAPTSAEPVAAISASHGVSVRGGVVRGYGRGYAARFERGGVELLPALGESAPRDFPLRFTLEEIRRGDVLLHRADASVEPRRDGDRIAYARGATIEERYEVTADGVYQSFRFDERPAGTGDLVVRGLLDTELVPHPANGGALVFEQDGLGGVRYGAVTGIDAAGHTVPGTLWSDGRTIELTLPGAFVDAAELPLVLDPLIGAEIAVNDSAWNDRDPDVAYGEGGICMVVWERVFSASHYGVYAQKVTDGGELYEGLIEVYDEGTRDRDPAVAYVAARNSFVVAWEHSAGGAPNIIVAAQIHYSEEEASFAYIVSAVSTNGQNNPRVGGDHSESDDEVFVVWQHAGVGVQGRLVTAQGNGLPDPTGPVVTIDANTGSYDCVAPYVSRSVGDEGSFLAVWERRSGSTSQVWGRAFTRDGGAVTDPSSLSFVPLTLRDNTNPVCDGDGTSFLVAWERSETWPPNGYRDVVGTAVEVAGDELLVAPFSIESYGDAVNVDEQRPTVAVTMGKTALVAWVQPNVFGLGQSLRTVGVDVFSGEPFGEAAVVADLQFVRSVAAAAANEFSYDDEVLLTWAVDTAAGQPRDVQGRMYESPGSWFPFLGACGDGGAHFTPNPVAGNPSFRLHLRGATPGVLAVLVIGGVTESVYCGPCRLLPKLETVYYRTTDAQGNASVLIPIDVSLAGVTFYSQWATFVPVGACPLAPLDFSTPIETTIATAP